MTFFNQSTGANESLRSGVPIYPIDPRGLTSLNEELVEVGAIPCASRASAGLPRLNLKPGQYQLRVAGAARGAERGSVRLDIEVPDFSDGDLNMSGIVLTSVARFQTPTFKPDPLLADNLPGPPTAARSFAPGDEVTTFNEVYDNAKPSPKDVEMAFSVVSTAKGRPLFSHVERAAATSDKVVRFRTNWTVPSIGGAYVLTVSARRPGAAAPSVTRQIPFEIK